jgi:hypothetical protein
MLFLGEKTYYSGIRKEKGQITTPEDADRQGAWFFAASISAMIALISVAA